MPDDEAAAVRDEVFMWGAAQDLTELFDQGWRSRPLSAVFDLTGRAGRQRRQW
jgi:hypothetical protein